GPTRAAASAVAEWEPAFKSGAARSACAAGVTVVHGAAGDGPGVTAAAAGAAVAARTPPVPAGVAVTPPARRAASAAPPAGPAVTGVGDQADGLAAGSPSPACPAVVTRVDDAATHCSPVAAVPAVTAVAAISERPPGVTTIPTGATGSAVPAGDGGRGAV